MSGTLDRSAHEMATPLVSVVIPAHNAAMTIRRALNSALGQTYRPIEIIVVDDASSDDTKKIVETFQREGVRLLTLPLQGGASRARNAGVDAASGELIAFLDADDEWLRSKLEKQVALMTSDPRLSLVFCDGRAISETGEDLGELFPERRIVTGGEAWRALLACNFVSTPAVLLRRKDIQSIGGFDHTLKIAEDQDMWIRLALVGHLGHVPESLLLVHIRGGSLSSDLDDHKRYTLPMIERHITALKDKLGPSDIRRIRGERLGRFGRYAYRQGKYGEGIRLILQSIGLGYRPFDGAYQLIGASPPAMWLRRLIRSPLRSK